MTQLFQGARGCWTKPQAMSSVFRPCKSFCIRRAMTSACAVLQSRLGSRQSMLPMLLQRKSTAADLKLQRVAQENEAARQARAAEAQLRHEYTHKRMEIKVAVLPAASSCLWQLRLS